ncbi:MAG: hypothetical protein ACRDSE_05575 [Pseudonocardiaceae bacterium]
MLAEPRPVPVAQTVAGVPVGATPVAEFPAPEPAGTPARPRSQKPYSALAGVFGVLAVVLAVVAGFLGYQYFNTLSVTSNLAMVDPAATANVKQEVSAAVETLFSYDYKNIEKTEQAANDLLANEEVRNTYNGLMGEVKRNAPKQQLIVTTQVSRIAVIDLSDDTARLLVFVDQSAQRGGQEEPSAAGGQLTVSAQKVDGTWKITGLDAYEDRGERQPRDQQPQPEGDQQAPNGDQPQEPRPSN